MRLLVLVLALLAGFGPAIAEEGGMQKRVALVIGNGAYRSVERLRNPGSDANLIAGTLKDLGFQLVGGGAQTNLDKAGLSHAVEEFGRALAGADVALFYYSGHGMQVQGVNWLVPVDANPTRAQDLDFQMVNADLVLRQMEGAGTKLNIVILDACRNNPFAVSGLRSVGSGLAEMRAPEGTLISYATQPGAVAADGAGANSPYSSALAEAMRQPGQDVFRTFNQVGLAVKRATAGRAAALGVELADRWRFFVRRAGAAAGAATATAGAVGACRATDGDCAAAGGSAANSDTADCGAAGGAEAGGGDRAAADGAAGNGSGGWAMRRGVGAGAARGAVERLGSSGAGELRSLNRLDQSFAGLVSADRTQIVAARAG